MRTIKLQYLQTLTKTVATINAEGEYEIKPTKYCSVGEEVWMIEADNTLSKAKIF